MLLTVSDTVKGKIQVNTIRLDENTTRIAQHTFPWTGIYFKDVPVPLTAIARPGYKFIKWLPTNDTSASITINLQSDSGFIALFEDADQLRDNNTPERLLMTKQIGDTVNVAMEALPEELRTAIVLREIEGLSYEEIATIMECPIGTVRSRIFRAREAISEKLKPLLDTAPNKRW